MKPKRFPDENRPPGADRWKRLGRGFAGVVLVGAIGYSCRVTPASAFYNVAMFWKRPGFTFSWPFTAGTDAQYTFGSSVELIGGVARLVANDQVDDDNTATGFGGGTLAGSTWDATNGYVRLTQTGTPTNTAELNSSWTPKYSNLVWYWKMNGTGAVTTGTPPDVGGGSLTVVGGSVNYATARLGTGIGIDGTIAIGTAPVGSIGDKITFAGWVKTTGTMSPWGVIFNAVSGSPTGWVLQNDDSGNWFVKVITTGGTNYCYTTGGVDGNWHHLAFTLSGGTADIYMDGVLQQECAYAVGGGFAQSGTYGQPLVNQLGSSNSPSAYYDDFAIWHDGLTAADVRTIYSRQSAKYSGTLTSRVMDAGATGQSWTTLGWKSTLPFAKEIPATNELQSDYPGLVDATGSSGNSALATNLMGLWHLDETTTGTGGAGKDFQDSSPSGYWGTKVGTMALGQAGVLWNAPALDGTSAYIDLGTSATALDQTDRTFSAWVFMTSYTADSPILDKDWDGFDGVNWGGWAFLIQSTGKLWFWLAPSADVYDSGTASIPLRVWTHVAVTYKSSTNAVKFYVNGVLNSTQTNTGVEKPSGATAKLLIGSKRNGAGRFFPGSIDEVAAWSRTLSGNEITELYRRGANRVKYQVRVCTASDCSDDASGANWKGPDGTNQTYFSELYNMSSQSASPSGTVNASLPAMLFSNFTSPVGTSRYFQYRTILESDDAGTGCNYGSGATWCSPELKSVTVDPVHYDSTAPSIVGATGVSFFSLSSFVETLGASCSSGIGYNLGVGASSATATWYWWDSTANAGAGGWVSADGTVTKSNSATTIAAHMSTFGNTAGKGTVYFKAFLKSSGSSKCELDNLSVGGAQ